MTGRRKLSQRGNELKGTISNIFRLLIAHNMLVTPLP